MTYSEIKALFDAVTMKEGFTVAFNRDKYDGVQVEIRNAEGGLEWRMWSYEEDFMSALTTEMARYCDVVDVARTEEENTAYRLRTDAMFYMSTGEAPLFSDFTMEQILDDVAVMQSEEIGNTAAAILRTAQMLQSPNQSIAVEVDMSEVIVFQENGADILRHTCKDDAEALAIFTALDQLIEGVHLNIADLLWEEAHAINYIVDAVKDGAARLDGAVIRNTKTGLYLRQWGVPSEYTLNPLLANWYTPKMIERGAVKQFCRVDDGDVIEPLSDAIKRVYALACKAA